MSTADDLAFPHSVWASDSMGNISCQASFTGMTLREYYAGLAMQGILSNSSFDMPRLLSDEDGRRSAASVACKCADELIAALEDQ